MVAVRRNLPGYRLAAEARGLDTLIPLRRDRSHPGSVRLVRWCPKSTRLI